MHLQSDAAVLFLNTVLNSISPTSCGTVSLTVSLTLSGEKIVSCSHTTGG